MVIRSEQLKVLEAYAEGAFTEEMVEHLKAYAPKVCKVVGEAGVRRIVESEIRHAREYGFANRGPVRLFLELTCSLGCGFDNDPQLRWAAEVLNDHSIPSDMARADRLYERTIVYFDQVGGPDQTHAVRALQRCLEFDFENAVRTSCSEGPMLELMAQLYPEKFAFIGEPVARVLLQQGAEEARRFGLTSAEGGAALAGMKFAMGHRIYEDPYYPWISSALTDPLIADSEGRLFRLTSRLRTYGKHVFAYLAQS